MGKGASKAKAAEAPPPELPGALKEKLSAMFDRMDTNKDGTVDKSEAIAFWGKNFAKVNAGAMFNEVDMDKNGEMTKDEWLSFWQNVLKHGYSVRARTLRQQSRPRPYLPPLVSLADFFWRWLRALCVCACLRSAAGGGCDRGGGFDDGGRQLGRLERRPHDVRAARERTGGKRERERVAAAPPHSLLL